MKFFRYPLLFCFVWSCLGSPFVLAGSLTSSSEQERLEAALAHYEELAKKDPWPLIPSGPKILINDRDDRVVILRKRLYAEGYLEKQSSAEPHFFDAEVEQALRDFQETHGLLPDGALGKFTTVALNAPASWRVCQLKIALQRLSTSPLVKEGRYLVVNIPDFSLTLFEGDKPTLHHRVIVGQRTKQTPLLTAQVSYLVINPDWNVPDDIAVKEELGKIQKDSNYLSRKKMKLISEEGEVDPSTIDWSKMQQEDFKYRIVQSPGAGNALGKIKFIFPNKYDVYLHDTPDHSLFEREDRALSHGCVRVDKPLDLATYLLKEDPNWDRDKIQKTIISGKQKVVPLATKVPIYIVYVTSWVDPDGTIQFREDLYKYDKGMAKTVCNHQ